MFALIRLSHASLNRVLLLIARLAISITSSAAFTRNGLCRYVEMKWNPPVDAINLRLIVCTFMTSAAARLAHPALSGLGPYGFRLPGSFMKL